jgi:hypothetical protein
MKNRECGRVKSRDEVGGEERMFGVTESEVTFPKDRYVTSSKIENDQQVI